MASKTMSTPQHTPLRGALVDVTPKKLDITPVGDHDRRPKVQLCLEMREKEVPTKSKSKKRVEQTVLEVTVMWVKHIPQSLGRRPNPFVKLLLLPQDTIMTTELKLEKNDAQYIEIFTFPLNSPDLTGNVLEVKVCDNKATRNAKLFGSVSIPLEKLKLGQPIISWYHLTTSEIDKDKTSSLTQIRKPKKKTIISKMTQDDEDEMKENANDTF